MHVPIESARAAREVAATLGADCAIAIGGGSTTGLGKAIEGIAALSRALPRIVANSKDIDARADALYGAWLFGAVLGNVGMALHHKLCHTLGGSFNLPHAETHTIVLPHAMAYNSSSAPEAMRDMCMAISGESNQGQSAAQQLFDLAKNNGAPVALRDLGMKKHDLDKACDIAMQNQYPNPRPLERTAL
jgi:maleylacetate reductase